MRNSVGRTAALGFVAAAISVVVFHQGLIWLLHKAGYVPNAPWSLRPVGPWGVPALANLCFWGGLWGILIAFVLRGVRGAALLAGFLIGVLGAAMVGWTLVPSLRGQPLFAGGNTVALLRSALINGTFGWGTALILTRAFRL
ncbi:hypothetical protein [Muricoccus vinaceus]|uniref:DUF1761 domain-containing protein n=1 Tax=Muricoccus vinaceus TaxID=424704 RepID=A0ABV6INV1_9PROT